MDSALRALAHPLSGSGELLVFDRALRAARERAFGAGGLSDALWAALVALEQAVRPLSFEALDGGELQHLGRSTLLRCLTLLEEAGLIEGRGEGPLPLLSSVALTADGRPKIAAVLADALARLGDNVTSIANARRDVA